MKFLCVSGAAAGVRLCFLNEILVPLIFAFPSSFAKFPVRKSVIANAKPAPLGLQSSGVAVTGIGSVMPHTHHPQQTHPSGNDIN